MDDELTPTQIAQLESQLRALQVELEELIASGKASAAPVELDPAKVGRLSRMDAMQGQQLAKATLHTNELRHRQVGVALRAIERGEYGWCARCEEPIRYERLAARPETPFCLRCQAASERR